jgi:sarcosine oxidase subunit beta
MNGSHPTADAVVIGAGLNGAATAFFLGQRGLRRIVVLESGLPGDGASGDAVGLLRTHYDNRPETQLAIQSMPYFREWPDRIGGSCGWIATGFFRFADQAEFWKLEANAAVQRELGDTIMVLDAAEVRGTAPGFAVQDIAGAVYEPGSGTADNHLATRTLLARACSEGAEVHPFTPAIEVLLDGDAVIGVRTSHGTISSPIVVIAAGSGSSAIAATCGIRLPTTGRFLGAAEVRVRDGFRTPGSYMDPITDSWIAPRGEGRVVIPAGPAVSDGRSAVVIAGLSRVVRRVPGLADAIVLRTWTREDAFTPDGKPIIGVGDGLSGLFINTGGSGKGHKVAPGAALALSELIVDGEATTVDLAPFALRRFSQPSRAWTTTGYLQQTIG